MASKFWDEYNLRLDPWGADYASPVAWEDDPNATSEVVELDVEGTGWGVIAPSASTQMPEKVIFIDGRRRLDARLVGRKGGVVQYGAFATLAVGAVEVDRLAGTARCLSPVLRRAIAVTLDEEPPVTHICCPLGGQGTLVYDLRLHKNQPEPSVPLQLVQKAMLEEEARLADDLAAEGYDLVIRDGPLRRNSDFGHRMLGYVKTLHKNYLPPERADLLWDLEYGERTPLFVIASQSNTLRRYSWYVRSGNANVKYSGLGYHRLHGLVRLELPADSADLATAIHLADMTARLIPEYASEPYRDPRAPQNLVPVGSLEKELGRHMGDSSLIGRRVANFLASLGDPA